MNIIEIDGSMGEGGGQILRTSLSLSALTGKPVRIKNIRSKRRKSGLLRQHLTAVRAAAEVCNAKTEGAELSSGELLFVPGEIRGGEYKFAVGTAGSACLVAQTVLPLLLAAKDASDVTFEGGTHNPSAPTYDYLDDVFFPALRKMGATIQSSLRSHGFYPAGGGSFRVKVTPSTLKAVHWHEAGAVQRITARATFAKLPVRVANRELTVLKQALGLSDEACQVDEVRSRGPGNVVSVLIERDHPELITSFGARGKKSESVAQEAADEAKRFIDADVPVGRHLADQLLLPMAIAGEGSFVTGELDPHTTTNILVIKMFLDLQITVSPLMDGHTRIRVGQV